MNTSINETLGRTILTGGTTLLSVAPSISSAAPCCAIFPLPFWSAYLSELIRRFSSRLPIVLWWSRLRGKSVRREVLETEAIKRKQVPILCDQEEAGITDDNLTAKRCPAPVLHLDWALLWQRPTLAQARQALPSAQCSLPCSGWERVGPPRKDHQTMEPEISRNFQDSRCSTTPILNIFRERLRLLTTAYISKPAIFNDLNLHEAYRRIKSRTNISSPELNALLRLYPDPINVVVFHGSSGRAHLGIGLALRCFQRLSFPNIAARRCS